MIYTEDQLVRIAKREANKKRNYLVVNRLQGKHIPVKPSEALELFHALAGALPASYAEEKILFVGFAETATAIGAGVASCFDGWYMQTTREHLDGVSYLYFSESHSHATEQKLVREDLERILPSIDRLVFVEDEVTTGNTILHLVEILKKEYPGLKHYGVASILNGMDGEALDRFAQMGIPCFYLVKTNHGPYAEKAETYHKNGTVHPVTAYAPVEMDHIREKEISGYMNARRLTITADYEIAVKELAETVGKSLQGAPAAGRILVIGTEEFMYPALMAAYRLECAGYEVKFHATTRSPIAVRTDEGYPLRERYELTSVYDRERKTFLYDIGAYDQVLVITDAKKEMQREMQPLLAALQQKNQRIQVIRWM